MTPKAQRIAIAEACGYGDYGTRMRGWDDLDIAQLPDYLNDLNAMAEAEKTLSVDDQITYAVHLTRGKDTYEVMPNDEHFTVCYGAIHTAAAERGEAFLRTIGKWEDDINA